MLEVLMSEFRNAFTEIEYEIDAQTRVVNAQAFGLVGRRFVRLYAGLAYHPLVGEDALAFALLHETGHHRAQGRRFAGDPMLACDCLADQWAIGVGARALRRACGRVVNIANALDSLDALVSSIDRITRGSRASPAKRSKPVRSCWAGHWPERKRRLGTGNTSMPPDPCFYTC